MSGGPEWFAPKRYGLGSGLPIAWQGWVVLVGFLAITLGLAFVAADRPLVFLSVLVPVTFLFMLIAAKTTKGGWRWRKGEDE